MADQTDFTPELTLTPNLDTAAAAAEAPKAPEAPTLTLDPPGAAAAAAACAASSGRVCANSGTMMLGVRGSRSRRGIGGPLSPFFGAAQTKMGLMPV